MKPIEKEQLTKRAFETIRIDGVVSVKFIFLSLDHLLENREKSVLYNNVIEDVRKAGCAASIIDSNKHTEGLYDCLVITISDTDAAYQLLGNALTSMYRIGAIDVQII